MENINFIHIPKNGGMAIRDICSKNIQLVYNYHNTDVTNKQLCNQMVILRNPIDRFISAVYYAIQKWSREPHIQKLISSGINTPNKWVEVWSNSNHKEYKNLMDEMLNKSHRVGGHLLKYKWTYSPQSFWINNPKYIIIMDDFKNEMQYFMDKTDIKGTLFKKNKTNHINDILSNKSKEFLMKFYENDFILYKKFKNINLQQRIPLQPLDV